LRKRLAIVAAGTVAAVSVTVGFSLLRAAAAGGGPSLVSQAAEQVSDRVAYVEQTLAINHVRLPRDYLIALATMNYVGGHVSTAEYGYLRAKHQPLPRTAAQALAMQAGICGAASTTVIAILDRFHVQARRVNVYYSTPHAPHNGHTTVEVLYGGTWHWFDPTWGTMYVPRKGPPSNVLSLLQVLRLPPAVRQRDRLGDDTRLWDRTVVAAGQDFGRETGMLFLTLPHLRVVVGGRTIYRR
jgi:hypothetical protein